MPYWNKGISYNVGKIEIAEFPLKYMTKIVMYPGSEKYSSAEKIKVAEAVVNRLLLFKMPHGKVEVRVVSLIPSFEYAKKKGFDISGNFITRVDNEFEGWQVIRSWNETLLGMWKISKGKRVQKVLLQARQKNASVIPAG